MNAEPLTSVEAPGEPAAPMAARRGPSGRVVVAVVMVALVAALIVAELQLSDANSQLATQRSLQTARTTAVVAARTDASDVASYDYRHLKQDFGKVERESTPKFRSSFVKSSDGLRTVLTQYKATATAKVLSAGVVSVTSTKAVVILFLNQKVTNTAQKGGATTDNSRIRVTLQWSGHSWLLSQLTLL